MVFMDLPALDRQLREARGASEDPAIAEAAWECLATSIAREVLALDEHESNELQLQMPVPPERYRVELEAFQAWLSLAELAVDNPVIVRARVMTELYVSFVWLRDSLIGPVAKQTGNGIISQISDFLNGNTVRRLRNSIAHGRWTYNEDFSGLDCWDGNPLNHFSVSQADYGKWQLLSRGTAVSIVLALTEGTPKRSGCIKSS